MQSVQTHTLDAVFALETANLIDRLTDQYGVPTEQKHLVAEEVLYVLLQLTSVPEMKMRLPGRVDLSAEQSSRLVDELYENLLRDHDVRTEHIDVEEEEGAAGEESVARAAEDTAAPMAHDTQTLTLEDEPEFLPHTAPAAEPAAEPPQTDIPHEPSPKHEEDTTPLIPSYKKPLTDTPRYNSSTDPYQERPQSDENKW